jgi:hypothetical protein
MKNRILILLLLAVCVKTYGQTNDQEEQKKTKVKAGVQFISNQTYAGRTDSLKLPVLIPEAKLEFPKGFFLNTKGYLNLSQHQTTFDGISFEPGYEFSKNKWNGSFSVIKNFISDSSNLIIAPVNASLEFYLNKETKILTPYIGWEYVFAEPNNDFILYGGLSKDIPFTKDDKETTVDAEPSFGLTGGTQSFYYSFLRSFSSNGGTSSGRGRGRGGILTSTTTTEKVKQESKQFTLLASEFELPVTVSTHKLKWITTPAIETPLNLVSSGTAGTQSTASFFYVTTELLFNF